MTKRTSHKIFVILGNQLFPPECLQDHLDSVVFMAEDPGLCTYVRHHQQKLVLVLAAMRAYSDELREAGFHVAYHELNGHASATYEEKLRKTVDEYGAGELVHFEIEGKTIEARIEAFAEARQLEKTVLPSPMFLCGRDEFAQFVDGGKRLQMADFYKAQRRRLGILVDDDGEPVGGQWSFDAQNRKKLPKSVAVPETPAAKIDKHATAIIDLVAERFADHPGDAREFWWPATRAAAHNWLERFLNERLHLFGPYEDAMSARSATLFHSALSPCLNLGLLTPRQIVDAVLPFADKKDVPMASLEGFLRQIIGWREFVRGVYRQFSNEQAGSNFWRHERELTEEWYAGTTQIPPLDDAIGTASRLGWLHHIYRLMVVGNLMTLSEIRPASAYRWFMEMFVDSSDWVMAPNVYGMALFSDGGIFATKPYICGSNYLLKMSDYKRGPWCDVVDGLYWRFVDKHAEFFRSNPRLVMMTRTLERISDDRRKRIFEAAEEFLERCTAA